MYIPAFATYNAETPKDIYNVEEILSQIFKTTGKMDGIITRLQEVESDEAKKTLFWTSLLPFSMKCLNKKLHPIIAT